VDVVYVDRPYYYCPPGFYINKWGDCVPLPVETTSAGDLWEGASKLQPQLLALEVAWRVFDPEHRAFTDALRTAYKRAAAKAWPEKEATTRADLVALAIGSGFSARAISSMPNIGVRASDALNRTWYVLANKLGYRGESADEIKASAQKQNPTGAEIPVIVIVIAVVAIAAVYALIVWKAAQLIDSYLARSAQEQELIRLHAEWQKIVDRHLEDPKLPWTPEELQILDRLEKAQAGIRETMAPTKQPEDKPLDPTTIIIAGLALVAGGFLYLKSKPT